MEATEHFSTRNVARILQSTEAQVRRWARLGGLAQKADARGPLEFTFQELILLRTTRGLLEAGIPPRRVQRVWSSLRRQLSDDLPLSSIRVLANGDRAIAWDGSSQWQPDSGQFLLDFDAGAMVGGMMVDASRSECSGGAEAVSWRSAPGSTPSNMPARVPPSVPSGTSPSAPTRVPPSTPARAPQPLPKAPPAAAGGQAVAKAPALSAEQWFHLGCELEETSPFEARQAYIYALAADPDLGDAHLNLGRLDHEAVEFGKAEVHYRNAVRSAPDDATCHFNLAVLLDDRGRRDDAILAYERAIACDAQAADAHYNLGLLLEARGRRADAMRHLMIARELYAKAGSGN